MEKVSEYIKRNIPTDARLAFINSLLDYDPDATLDSFYTKTLLEGLTDE